MTYTDYVENEDLMNSMVDELITTLRLFINWKYQRTNNNYI
jgi:hypothetical protein